MSDLLKRLRSMHWCVTTEANGVGVSDRKVASEAADRIEQLVATNEQLTTERDRLREAVDDALYAWDSHKQGGYPMEGWWVSGARAAHKGD